MSVMYKKDAILKLGNYMNTPHFEDYYLWINALKNNYYVENLKEIIILANNNSHTMKNRGGLKYIKPTLQFQKYLYKNQYISFLEYIKNIIIRIIVALIPNKLRTLIYTLFLRKKYKNNISNIKDNLIYE